MIFCDTRHLNTVTMYGKDAGWGSEGSAVATVTSSAGTIAKHGDINNMSVLQQGYVWLGEKK